MNRFISCDWGTSRLRLRLAEGNPPRILAEHATNEGIKSLATAQGAGEGRRNLLKAVLERGIAALGVGSQAEIPVVISGMASSTLGWQSLPYAGLPAPIDGSTLHFVDFLQAGRRIRLVSGLQAASDVIRGEETELIGLFADPSRRTLAEDCIVVLPGSHSKHVQLRAGQIIGFTTYLTGELYGLLCRDSTLEIPAETTFDPASFVAGIRASRSLGLSAALFQTRAQVVLGQLPARHSRAFLSGVLVGAEVAALIGASARHIMLAASEALVLQYTLALGELLPAATVTRISPAELTTATVEGHARILSYS